MPARRKPVAGRIESTLRLSEPNRRVAVLCSTIMIPTAATTLASCGASRIGRNTSRWASSPSTTPAPSDSANAAMNDFGPPRSRNVGQSGSDRSPPKNRLTTPSTNASGLGSGSSGIRPVRRSSL